MSAIGMEPDFASRTRIISAHADYRRSDFMFARAQSHAMRAAPWGRRMRRMHSWGEIGGYAAAIGIATVLASAFV